MCTRRAVSLRGRIAHADGHTGGLACRRTSVSLHCAQLWDDQTVGRFLTCSRLLQRSDHDRPLSPQVDRSPRLWRPWPFCCIFLSRWADIPTNSTYEPYDSASLWAVASSSQMSLLRCACSGSTCTMVVSNPRQDHSMLRLSSSVTARRAQAPLAMC